MYYLKTKDISIVDSTESSFRTCEEEVLDLRHFLDNVQGDDGEHALGHPQRVSRRFHELVPDDKVQHEQDHNVACEEYGILIITLSKVVED